MSKLYTLDDNGLIGLFNRAMKLGGVHALVAAGEAPATISQAQAYKLYGRNDIDRWVQEGLIKRIQDGNHSKVRYSLIELTNVALNSNRHTYLEVHER